MVDWYIQCHRFLHHCSLCLLYLSSGYLNFLDQSSLEGWQVYLHVLHQCHPPLECWVNMVVFRTVTMNLWVIQAFMEWACTTLCRKWDITSIISITTIPDGVATCMVSVLFHYEQLTQQKPHLCRTPFCSSRIVCKLTYTLYIQWYQADVLCFGFFVDVMSDSFITWLILALDLT